jgi:hypothetical protein
MIGTQDAVSPGLMPGKRFPLTVRVGQVLELGVKAIRLITG